MNEDRASRYQRLRRSAAVLSGTTTVLLLAGLVASGGAAWLRQLAVSWSHGAPGSAATVALFVTALAILHAAVSFPLTFYRGFLLERQYGLSSQRFGQWLGDHAKGGALGLLVGVGGAEVVYRAMAHSPSWWWLITAAAFTGAIVILARLTPVLILPLFYRFAPLDRDALKTRLHTLSERAGVAVLGVFEWGLGERTRRANAALVGTGATRRIILSDTLLAEYSDDEIEVILAHELGHHAHHDIVVGLAIEAVLVAAACYAARLAIEAWWQPAGLASPADVAGLPILLLAAGAVMVASTPAVNAFSRLHERRADRYALGLTGRPEPFMSAMRRLAAQNLAEPRPSAFARWFFHTHPPVEERIEAARLARRSR